ncbi:hypothetical protein KY284_013343 [Solanum tuberosum]|nr:hypothetical protein KY284_013343 [Solanum tuberosum]
MKLRPWKGKFLRTKWYPMRSVENVLKEKNVMKVPSNSEKYPLGGIISAIQNEFHATSELIRLGDADAYYVIIVDRLGHVILCEVINDQKVSKTDEVNSGILQVANQILILFVKVFTGNNPNFFYSTPGYRMKFIDMNLEDKVLFEGGSIVVNPT